MSQLASARVRGGEDVTGNKTLDVTDNGFVQNVTASATITLPSTVVGYVYTIRNGGEGGTDGAVTVTIDPAAADAIEGFGTAGTADKDIVNTLGHGGDEITLLGDGVDGWRVVESFGTWTREG